MNIENKVVVVTGAASGIGRALAQAFKNARADKVYIADLNEEGLAETANLMDGIAIKTDVSKESEIIYTNVRNKYKVSILSFSRLYPKFLYPSDSQYDFSVKIDDKNIKYYIDILNPISWFKVSNYILKNNFSHVIFRYWNPFFVPLYLFINWRIKF